MGEHYSGRALKLETRLRTDNGGVFARYEAQSLTVDVLQPPRSHK